MSHMATDGTRSDDAALDGVPGGGLLPLDPPLLVIHPDGGMQLAPQPPHPQQHPQSAHAHGARRSRSHSPPNHLYLPTAFANDAVQRLPSAGTPSALAPAAAAPAPAYSLGHHHHHTHHYHHHYPHPAHAASAPAPPPAVHRAASHHSSASARLAHRALTTGTSRPGTGTRCSYTVSPSSTSGRRPLDPAALAAAAAAAPINPSYPHHSLFPGAGASLHPDVLEDLRALDDLEGGALLRPLLQPPVDRMTDHLGGDGDGGQDSGEGGPDQDHGLGEGAMHVDEAETYEMQELMEAKPKDVLQHIEEEGVVKLGEFEVADGLAFRAFGDHAFLTIGQEHAEPPAVKEMWMEVLREGGKMQETGWTSTVMLEAHVVNLYDAAAPGDGGLLRPLLARLRVHGCPPTVFALPAVQAVIQHKWDTWARHFLVAEFFFYVLWLAAFSAFSLLLEDGPGKDPDEDPGGDGEDDPDASLEGLNSLFAGAGAGGAGVVARMLLNTISHRLGGGRGRGRAAAAAAAATTATGAATMAVHHAHWAWTNAIPLLWRLWDWSALMGMLHTWRGVAQLVTGTVAVAAMMPFGYMELCTLAVQRTQWLNLWNLMDCASYLLAGAVWWLHLRLGPLTASSWFSVALAVQHVLLWTKLHYYARVFSPSRGAFNDTVRIVLSELRAFLIYLGLVMMGFAFAFYCLFRQDRHDFLDFSNLWHSFASMFAYMLQMFDYNVLYECTNPVVAMVLFMAYELITAVLLLNIMIALMTSAFARAKQDEGLRFSIYKAEVIDELESTLPRWLMRGSWYPHFVHVLKISPSSTYEVNLNSVWTGIGNLQSSLVNAQEETKLRVESLEGKVDLIDQKLSAAVRLLASRLVSHEELAAALSVSAFGGEVGEGGGEGSEAQEPLDPNDWQGVADSEYGDGEWTDFGRPSAWQALGHTSSGNDLQGPMPAAGPHQHLPPSPHGAPHAHHASLAPTPPHLAGVPHAATMGHGYHLQQQHAAPAPGHHSPHHAYSAPPPRGLAAARGGSSHHHHHHQQQHQHHGNSTRGTSSRHTSALASPLVTPPPGQQHGGGGGGGYHPASYQPAVGGTSRHSHGQHHGHHSANHSRGGSGRRPMTPPRVGHAHYHHQRSGAGAAGAGAAGQGGAAADELVIDMRRSEDRAREAVVGVGIAAAGSGAGAGGSSELQQRRSSGGTRSGLARDGAASGSGSSALPIPGAAGADGDGYADGSPGAPSGSMLLTTSSTSPGGGGAAIAGPFWDYASPAGQPVGYADGGAAGTPILGILSGSAGSSPTGSPGVDGTGVGSSMLSNSLMGPGSGTYGANNMGSSPGDWAPMMATIAEHATSIGSGTATEASLVASAGEAAAMGSPSPKARGRPAWRGQR